MSVENLETQTRTFCGLLASGSDSMALPDGCMILKMVTVAQRVLNYHPTLRVASGLTYARRARSHAHSLLHNKHGERWHTDHARKHASGPAISAVASYLTNSFRTTRRSVHYSIISWGSTPQIPRLACGAPRILSPGRREDVILGLRNIWGK